MFAPKVAKPQAKLAESSERRLSSQRASLVARPFGGSAIERALLLQQTIGNQATARLLARQTSRPAVSNPPIDYEQEAGATENAMTSRGASWDFSQIPLFPPDRASRSHGSSPQPAIIQRKLVVGQDNDQLEHEADRAADQVMRMPAPDVSTTAAPPQISRKCAACEEEQNLQKKPAGPQAAAGEAPASVHEVLRSPGQPLDAATRAYFEPRFKYDFSAVRVHADAQATESARQISSLAYTVGTNVVFRSDTYAPDTPAGKGLLAHEMAHIVQQRHATANGPLSLGRPGGLAEQEAELAANRVTAGQQVALPRATENAAQVVRRSPGPKKPTPPSPPEWLGPLQASATHLSGDLWEVRLTGLGLSPVGPHKQMQAYLRTFNQNRPRGVERMVSAHIIGGEHIRDLGWDMPYDEAPCVGVSQSQHDKWSGEINSHMGSKGMGGGRATKTTGRTIIGPDVVKAIHADVYMHFPELRDISLRIINLEAKRIMGAKYGMPKPTSPMDVHKGSPMPAPKSPMDVHKGSPMPAPKSPMDVHKGSPMPKPKSSMDPTELLGIEPEVATPTTWRPRFNISGRTVRFGLSFRTIAATFGEFALTVGLSIAFEFLKRWMINNAIEDKYKEGWKAVGSKIDTQMDELKPEIAKQQLKLDEGEKVFANVVVKVYWIHHRISSHFQTTEWDEPDVVLADIYLMTKPVERERSYEAQVNLGSDRYPNMVKSKVDEFTRGFEVQVFSDDELVEFRDLYTDYLARKRRLYVDPYNAKLRDEVHALRKQIGDTYGPDAWPLEIEEAAGTAP
jgi:Domain of unknown function (DUF4157)